MKNIEHFQDFGMRYIADSKREGEWYQNKKKNKTKKKSKRISQKYITENYQIDYWHTEPFKPLHQLEHVKCRI